MFKELPLWKKIMYTALLILPLALALVWLYYIKLTEKAAGLGVGTFLSPVNNKPIIIGLSIFMFGYTIFLLIMFYSNLKEVIHHTFHKE